MTGATNSNFSYSIHNSGFGQCKSSSRTWTSGHKVDNVAMPTSSSSSNNNKYICFKYGYNFRGQHSDLDDFGTDVALDFDGTKYIMHVSAPSYPGSVSGITAPANRGGMLTYEFTPADVTTARTSLIMPNFNYSSGSDYKAKATDKLKANDYFGQTIDIAGNAKDIIIASMKGNDKGIYVVPPYGFNLFSSRFGQTVAQCLNKNSTHPIYSFDYSISDEPASHDTVGYSCVDVDWVPDSVLYQSISSSSGLNASLRTITVHPSTGLGKKENMSELYLQWGNANSASPFTFDTTIDTSKWPKFADWDQSASLLKVQIIPYDAGGFSRSSLINSMRIFYLYPKNGSSLTPSTDPYRSDTVIDFSTINNGDIFEVGCDTTSGKCDVTFTKLPDTLSWPDNHGKLPTDPDEDEMEFIVNIRPLYHKTDIKLQAYALLPTTPTAEYCPGEITARTPNNLCVLHFRDVQAVLRATGFAGGASDKVQVRIEERIPLGLTHEVPAAGIWSAETLCKVLVGDKDKGSTVGAYPNAQPRQYNNLGFSAIDRAARDNCKIIW